MSVIEILGRLEDVHLLTLEMGSGVIFDPREVKRVIIFIFLYVQKQIKRNPGVKFVKFSYDPFPQLMAKEPGGLVC